MSKKGWSPQRKNTELITACRRYFEEYSDFVTLKQLHYLLVAEGTLRNDEASWRRLKTTTLNARKSGRLEPTSFSQGYSTELSYYPVDADAYLTGALQKYRIPRTVGQENYVEIWVERASIVPFVRHLIGEYDVPVYVTGGYSDYSFSYCASERLKHSVIKDGSPRILYLSDFSTSSFKMFESLSDELASALGLSRHEVSSILFKGAVLPEHIAKHSLPACYTPSKEKRSKKFDELYGDIIELLELPAAACVELEALNPKALAGIINSFVFNLLDPRVMSEVAAIEAAELDKIKKRLTRTDDE